MPILGYKIINLTNGFIKVSLSLQFINLKYVNLFAYGDITDGGAYKVVRPRAK